MALRSTLPLKTLVIAASIGIITVLVAWTGDELPKAHAYHSQEDLEQMRGTGIGLASGANNFFRASGDCYGCHGPDTNGPVFANATPAGVDVNPGDNWRSTMMGNSARDPFWRAKLHGFDDRVELNKIAVTTGDPSIGLIGPVEGK